jgi:predicted nucleotide-binding protein
MQMIENSLNRIESTIKRDLQARVTQFVQALPRHASPPLASEAPTPETKPAPLPATPPMGKQVFVVHGHDRSARLAVENLLYTLALEPIVLQEQAGTLLTIIERLEYHGDVQFAVVLLTPDDEGRLRSEAADLKTRARQNVILELGYFIGKLGRKRVCALHAESLEIPSDLSGIHYLPLDDAGRWQLMLKRELVAAGFEIDPRRLV